MSQPHINHTLQTENSLASNGVKYLLDFDGVIFDAFALKSKMAALGMEEKARSKETFDEIAKLDPSFSIAELIFEDARLFIQAHAQDCEIVSSYVSTNPLFNGDIATQRTYQTTKIILCGVADMVGMHNVHVVGRSKVEMLSGLKFKYEGQGKECLFVDDRLEYINEATNIGLPAFFMDRKKADEVDEDVLKMPNRITSFKDLEDHLQSWKK